MKGAHDAGCSAVYMVWCTAAPRRVDRRRGALIYELGTRRIIRIRSAYHRVVAASLALNRVSVITYHALATRTLQPKICSLCSKHSKDRITICMRVTAALGLGIPRKMNAHVHEYLAGFHRYPGTSMYQYSSIRFTRMARLSDNRIAFFNFKTITE